MLALGRWGFRSMGEPGEEDVVTADSLTMALRTAFRPELAAAPLDFQIQVGPVTLRARCPAASPSCSSPPAPKSAT